MKKLVYCAFWLMSDWRWFWVYHNLPGSKFRPTSPYDFIHAPDFWDFAHISPAKWLPTFVFKWLFPEEYE